MQSEHCELEAERADTHWWWVARRKVLRRFLGRFLGKNGKRKILDVGCSTGSNLRMLQDFGTVHAMEMDEPAVEYCRMRFPGIRVYDGGIPDPLRDTYDVICLFDVLEFIEDEEGALEWIDDHLAPGGVLLVTVPAFDFLRSRQDELAHHFRRYTKPVLEALLRRHFDLAYSSYFNTHLFPAIAAVRLISASAAPGRWRKRQGRRRARYLQSRSPGRLCVRAGLAPGISPAVRRVDLRGRP